MTGARQDAWATASARVRRARQLAGAELQHGVTGLTGESRVAGAGVVQRDVDIHGGVEADVALGHGGLHEHVDVGAAIDVDPRLRGGRQDAGLEVLRGAVHAGVGEQVQAGAGVPRRRRDPFRQQVAEMVVGAPGRRGQHAHVDVLIQREGQMRGGAWRGGAGGRPGR